MAYRRRRPRFGTTGCLFWLFILLVIVVIFLFRGKGNLKEAFSFLKKVRLASTEERKPEREGFAGREKTAPDAGLPADRAEKTEPPRPADGAERETKPGPGTGAETPGRSREAAEKPGSPSGAGSGAPGRGEAAAVKKPAGEKPKAAREAPQAKKGEIKVKNLPASLYFVRIDGENGSVRPVPVARSVQYRDSPITRTFEALLKGPTDEERDKGIISLIPDGTRLLSAKFDDGHLTLDFSHHFEENYTGSEAILLELSQVILTSFGFDQVTRVSIRIEGKQKRYITGEGIPLKEAYTKQDIPSLGPGNPGGRVP
jgi:spore germination protein GerM